MSHNEGLRMLRCTGRNGEKRNVSTLFGWVYETVVCPLFFKCINYWLIYIKGVFDGENGLFQNCKAF